MEKSQRSLFGDEAAPWEQDAKEEACVARVVFAEAPYGPFDYLVPDRERGTLRAGMRVSVPLGRRNRIRTAYCISVFDPDQGPDEQQPASSWDVRGEFQGTSLAPDRAPPRSVRRLKPLTRLIDSHPLLTPDLLRLAHWIAAYYLSPLGQVFEAMIPAAVRDQAGTREQTFLSVPTQVLAQLTQLKLPAKQAAALKHLAASETPLTVAELAALAGCTAAPIQSLRKKGLIAETTARVSTYEGLVDERPAGRPHVLNDDQQLALATIQAALEHQRHESLVLHGITGSGKTEVYIQAIEKVIGFGRQAIVLVPEISLTPQTRQRFRERFSRVAVLHSHLSPSERHHQWKRIAAGEIEVIVGARSAIFAPAPRLGLIVLDEEHDASFKQDKSPRYHAREVATYRAGERRIPLVLGSATPSLETWAAIDRGEARRISLPARVSDRPLPDVRLVDLRVEYRRRESKGLVSRPLHAAIRDALGEEGQVILLLNRRGFARHIQCPACGATVQCPRCDLALTHHKQAGRAVCHYCEYERPSPRVCPQCDFEGIRYAGHGTQRLEDELRSRFASASVLRMDSDSMQRPGSHEAALDRFRKHEIDILLGTQMIAKGLDFPNVTLVGVINADTSLHFPDFRASERTFSLVTQVAGRSGRGEKGGRVLVQTFSPEHPAVALACQHDYTAFAAAEMVNRRALGYPPQARMARFVFRGADEEQTLRFAAAAMREVGQEFGMQPTAEQPSFQSQSQSQSPSDTHSGPPSQATSRPAGEAAAEPGQLGQGTLARLRDRLRQEEPRLLGPTPAAIAKIREKFRFHALVLTPYRTPLQEPLAAAMARFPQDRDIEWIVDIDPLEML